MGFGSGAYYLAKRVGVTLNHLILILKNEVICLIIFCRKKLVLDKGSSMSGPIPSNPNPNLNVQSSVPNLNTEGVGEQLTNVTEIALSILGSPRSRSFPFDPSKVLRQQPDLPNDPYVTYIELNSVIEPADIGLDRTYYYSNQDYEGIGEELEKIEPVGERN